MTNYSKTWTNKQTMRNLKTVSLGLGWQVTLLVHLTSRTAQYISHKKRKSPMLRDLTNFWPHSAICRPLLKSKTLECVTSHHQSPKQTNRVNERAISKSAHHLTWLSSHSPLLPSYHHIILSIFYTNTIYKKKSIMKNKNRELRQFFKVRTGLLCRFGRNSNWEVPHCWRRGSFHHWLWP